MTMVKPYQVIGLIGSLLVICGLFLPVVSIPFMGEKTYFQSQDLVAKILFALAILSVVFVIIRLQIGLWGTGLLMVGILTYSYFDFEDMLSQYDNVFDGGGGNSAFYQSIKNSFRDSIQMKYGLGVIASGILVTFAAAGIKTAKH